MLWWVLVGTVVVATLIVAVVFGRRRTSSEQQRAASSSASSSSKKATTQNNSNTKGKGKGKGKLSNVAIRLKTKDTTKNHPLFVQRLKVHTAPVTDLCFNPKGKYLASIGADRTIYLFHTDTLSDSNTRSQRINTEFDHGEACCFSPDGYHLLLVMATTKQVRIYGLKKEKGTDKVKAEVVKEFPTKHADEVRTIRMAHNNKYILTCSEEDTKVSLWSLQGKELETLDTKKMRNYMASLSPNNLFTVASFTADVPIWEVETKKGKEWEFNGTRKVMDLSNGHRGSVYAVCFSADGKLLATASKDCTLRIWDVNVRWHQQEDPKPVHKISLEEPVQRLAFTPDNKVIAATSGPSLLLFSVESGELLDKVATAHENGSAIAALSWSADSLYLATAADSTIKVWKNPLLVS
ncbi:WD40 repeat domain-containing protein [Balamuthia mandrillaris]